MIGALSAERRQRPLSSKAIWRRDAARRDFDLDPSGEFVLVPIDAYEELIKAEMAAGALATLERDRNDPSMWIDGRQAALELAGMNIADARKAAGLTQKQLGHRLGLPQSQISRIERYPDRTTVRTLKRVAKALKVDIAAFMRLAK